MASRTSSDGIIAGYIVAGFCIGAGLAIVSNWRDYGLKYFNFVIDIPLPGMGWYRRRGLKVFRALVGGGGILVGLTFLIGITIGLLNR